MPRGPQLPLQRPGVAGRRCRSRAHHFPRVGVRQLHGWLHGCMGCIAACDHCCMAAWMDEGGGLRCRGGRRLPWPARLRWRVRFRSCERVCGCGCTCVLICDGVGEGQLRPTHPPPTPQLAPVCPRVADAVCSWHVPGCWCYKPGLCCVPSRTVEQRRSVKVPLGRLPFLAPHHRAGLGHAHAHTPSPC